MSPAIVEFLANSGAVVFLLATLALCAFAMRDAVRAWREGGDR